MLIFDILPNEILILVFTKWLSAKEIVLFDTSISDQKSRPEFLRFFVINFDGSKTIAYPKSYIRWLIYRKIKVKYLKVLCVTGLEFEGFGHCSEMLEYLYISDQNHTVTGKWSSIFQSCGSLSCLRQLNIHHFYLKIADIRDLCHGCEKIEELALTRCGLTNDMVVIIAETYHLLRALNISCNSKITDQSLSVIFEKSKNLKYLCLASTAVTISGFTRSKFGACSRVLQSIDLSFCNEITDSSIISVAGSLDKLISLNISYCDNITTGVLTAIGKICTGLEILLYDRDTAPYKPDQIMLTDNDVVEFVKSIVGLRSLSLLGHTELTEFSGNAIADSCPRLEELTFEGLLNNLSIFSICIKCTKLKRLDVIMLEAGNLQLFEMIGNGVLPDLVWMRARLCNRPPIFTNVWMRDRLCNILSSSQMQTMAQVIVWLNYNVSNVCFSY